ncbi:hypothetical protein B7494_g5543 [Chlorociboria aeruginascens]|nr:hypothetical protein B7494_g5543 [Chlorociboria aeruginascens]
MKLSIAILALASVGIHAAALPIKAAAIYEPTDSRLASSYPASEAYQDAKRTYEPKDSRLSTSYPESEARTQVEDVYEPVDSRLASSYPESEAQLASRE